MEVKDSGGNALVDGDSVRLIKDLRIKGSTVSLKRGDMVKSIRLTSSEEEVQCVVGTSTILLQTCFLKKV